MISRLRNWWGTLPASSERAPKTSPSASAPLGTAPSVLATPKDEQPNKATVPDGRELFLAASSAEEREQVLKNHPFWQTKDVELQLGVAEVAAVIEHVSELYAKYHFRLSHPVASTCVMAKAESKICAESSGDSVQCIPNGISARSRC